MRGRFEPLSSDLEASRRFGHEAIVVRAAGGREPAGWAHAYEERLAGGSINGRLYVVGGVPQGFVSWTPGGAFGASVDLLSADQDHSGTSVYAEILELVQREVGPVAFVSGPLPGLTGEEEEHLLRPLGFRRYSRSEMVLGAAADLGAPVPVAGETLRPVGPADTPELADLHRRAYRYRFDRFLFLEVQDERDDALRGVNDILGGRWGEFSATGSWGCERGSHLVGAVLSVQSPAGTLIADVMVDPAAQGHGIGHRLLTTVVRALRGGGERHIYLNVTEGNERAIRLYRRLGFVRSLGPTKDWYSARLIPVGPHDGS